MREGQILHTALTLWRKWVICAGTSNCMSNGIRARADYDRNARAFDSLCERVPKTFAKGREIATLMS